MNIFDAWNVLKQRLHSKKHRVHFKPTQIWWVHFGHNISTEIKGKGEQFLRPAVILKKVYGNACVVLPLSSVEKQGSYYFNFIDTKKKSQCAHLAQVRYIDGKRLKYQVASISLHDFQKLKEHFIGFIKNNPT